MSVVKPCIDDLLEKTDHNRFLLASLASKRACDINSMLRGQHNRVLAVQDVDDITIGLSGADTISMAMDEIVDGDISYDEATRLLKPKWRLASAWSTITRLD